MQENLNLQFFAIKNAVLCFNNEYLMFNLL